MRAAGAARPAAAWKPAANQDIPAASSAGALERWSREYGPLFRFELGGRVFLAVADHEVFGAALRDRPETFARSTRPGQVLNDIGLEMGLFFANGELWRRQRRMVMAALGPAHIRAYVPSLHKVTRRLQTRWRAAADRREPIELQADLTRFTVDAIAGLAFGADVNTLESDADVIQRHLDCIFPALQQRSLALLPYWRWLRLPRDRRLDRSVIAINAAIAGFIAQARDRMQAEPTRRQHPGNLLEAMIAAADEGDSGVDDHDVAGNVLLMLLAGEDTTANTLAWMIELLWRHPGAMRLARDEVRSLGGDAANLSLEEIGRLDYLEACAHETMRLKPVAPLQTVQAVRNTCVADIRVPANTVVWGVMRHDCLDERHFSNATTFDPQRWLAEAGPTREASAAKRVSMPFGAGPRVCPGRHLALVEMKMVMAMLLGCFEIERLDTPAGEPAEERLAFTMAPVGLQMTLLSHRHSA